MAVAARRRPFRQRKIIQHRQRIQTLFTDHLALNGNAIGNNLIINLWSSNRTIHDEVSTDLHKFEVIGLKAAGFVFNFSDHTRPYYTVLDGLQFDRAYSAQVACEYAGSVPRLAGTAGDRTPSIISELKTQMDIPTVNEVLKWLERNKLGSTQAYTAFATAFEKARADSTQIKVACASRELCERAAHWLLLLPVIRPFCNDAAERLEDEADQPITPKSAIGCPLTEGNCSERRPRGRRPCRF